MNILRALYEVLFVDAKYRYDSIDDWGNTEYVKYQCSHGVPFRDVVENLGYKEENKMALETTLSESQQKIVEITEGMKDLLLYKNHKYGDSALHPKQIFYKGDAKGSIEIRLDDKLGRVINCDELRANDVADIIGYCTLLLISMGVTKEDLQKFMD